MSVRDPITEYLSVSSETKENANYNRSASGLEAHVADYYIKINTLKELYPPWVGQMFLDGDFHVHNLTKGRLPYCFGADLMLLLSKGMITDTIVGKPAKHFDTALDHIVNFMGTNQQEWAGAQAVSHVNTLLAPFAAYDKLSYKDMVQGWQRCIFNLGFPSRSGYQTIFSNFIMDFTTPKFYRDQDVIVGGSATGDSYPDFEEEAEMLHMAFWDVMNQGDGYGNIFTFPIPTLNITSKTKWDTELMKLIMKNVVRRGQPYFFNYWGSGIDEDTIRAMCCRLNLDLSQLPPSGGRWAYEGGTGSIAVVTLNMARVGYLSKSEDAIFERIGVLMNRAKDILLRKTEIIQASKDIHRIMPLARFYDINFDRFFRTIGMLGFDELFVNFSGSPLSENVALAKKILLYMRDLTREFQEETGYLHNLEMTPGEGSSWSLALKDKKKYPDIYTRGQGEGVFYSAVIPPSDQEMSMSERIALGNELMRLFTGGTVFRIPVGENKPSIASVKKFIQKLASGTKITYFDLAVTFSKCKDRTCNHEMRGVYYECKRCGGETRVFSRVVGYYRSHDRYNPGKLSEFKSRAYQNL